MTIAEQRHSFLGHQVELEADERELRRKAILLAALNRCLGVMREAQSEQTQYRLGSPESRHLAAIACDYSGGAFILCTLLMGYAGKYGAATTAILE